MLVCQSFNIAGNVPVCLSNALSISCVLAIELVKESDMGENSKLGNTSVRIGCPTNIAGVIRPNNYIYSDE